MIVVGAMNARLSGWGPDHTEIIMSCPQEGCSWSREWDSSVVTVTLAAAADAVSAHLVRDHGVVTPC